MPNRNEIWSNALRDGACQSYAFDRAVEWMDDALGFMRDCTAIPTEEVNRRAKALIKRAEEQI